MAFLRSDGIGGQGITDVSTTQLHPLGMKIRAYDSTYGYGEFTYVKGVSSGAAGLCCIITPLHTGVTAITGARSKGSVGVFMSALDATTKFGWVQTGGTAAVQVAGGVSAGATVYLAASGKVDDAVVAGDIVYGANFATGDGTPEANWALVTLSSPYAGDTDNA